MNVPIQESVGAAFRFARENARFVMIVAASGAAAATIISALSIYVPMFSLLGMVAGGIVQAFVYAALLGAALFGADAARTRWMQDGWRVWASMVVVGFFLFILLFVLTIPVTIALVAGPLAPYVADLSQAGSDEAAVMGVMTNFAEQNPGALLAVMLFYCVIWFLVTSRLYLAAPASVDRQRILTFETWPWTKGAMLRITAARVLLLVPAYILVGAVSHLLGRLIGIDTLNPGTIAAVVSANPIGLIGFEFISTFIVLALYSPLEAGLSAYLYQGLKPADAPPAEQPPAA